MDERSTHQPSRPGGRATPWRRITTLFIALAIVLTGLPAGIPMAGAASPNLVISQVYGGGGNSGAPFTHDFIELFNRSATPVSLNGLSVQYASAAGTGNFGASATQITELPSVTLGPGQYYLIQEASQAAVGAALPTPDLVDATPIAMSGTAGKVALVNSTASLGCNGGSTPCSPAATALIIDLVGYGSANYFEGAGAAPAPSNTTADLRGDAGCVETDNNNADFATGAPAPRNTTTAPKICGGPPPPTNPSGSGSATPNSVQASETTLLAVAVTPGTNPTSTGLAVSGNLTAIGGPASQPFFDDGTNGDATAGDNTFSFRAIVAAGTTPGAKSLPAAITDAQTRAGNTTIALTVTAPPAPPTTRIRDIQGAAHTSPLLNQNVTNVQGIVTAVRSNGFYIQDPSPDTNDATSEAIFVFTSSAPGVAIGDDVTVAGTVSEFRPGGSGGANNLSITQIGSPTITPLPDSGVIIAPTLIGNGGRVPPTTVIDNDAAGGNAENPGTPFDPAQDGLDFYESLEAMLVQVNNAVAVGPTNDFGEIPVLADNGANAAVRTTRGGIVIRADDFNPERIFIDDAIVGAEPQVNVGATFGDPIVGVIDYSFSNFKLLNIAPLPAPTGGATREATGGVTASNQLAIATFNVENLDPRDDQAKFDALGNIIVTNLKAPDIIALEEIQDNNGPTNDMVVDADQTYTRLIAAISAAGGPTYQFRQINPVDDQDGGEPGGNIRVGFLFRADRGVEFVDRPGGGPTTPTTVIAGATGPELSASPGRIDPTNPAFNNSRKPLAGEFRFRGQTLFVVANHFNSKGGDQPLFGRFQPPTRGSEVQRRQQAQIVNNFVDSILAADPNANVVVLGDINDFQFSEVMAILKGGVLNNLIDTLPIAEQYTYVFEGNSQALDHILVSNGLNAKLTEYDVVHVNSEFADQISDHDPQVARFAFASAPVARDVAAATGEDTPVTIALDATDADGDALTYTIVSGPSNGTLGAVSGNQVAYTPNANFSGTDSFTYRANDGSGNSNTATVTITVTAVNDDPTIAPVAPREGQYSDPIAPFTVTATDPDNAPGQLTFAATGLPAGLALKNNGDGTATVSGTVTAPAGTYTATYTVTDGAGGSATTSAGITVTKESATAAYTGDRAASGSGNSKTVDLRATITEQGDGSFGSAVAAGNTPGVLFRVCGAAGCTTVPAASVTATGTPGVWVATARATLTDGNYQVTVAFDPANGYFTGPDSAPAPLTVATAGKQRTDGRGIIADPAAADGRGAFLFDLRFNRDGSVRGSARYIYREGNVIYEVRSTALDALAFPTATSAVFEGPCAIVARDARTGRTIPALGRSDLRCEFAVEEVGGPRDADRFALTIRNADGTTVIRSVGGPLLDGRIDVKVGQNSSGDDDDDEDDDSDDDDDDEEDND